MKQLLAGILFIVVIAMAGFFYRNVTEKPGAVANQPACTEEAKICPDGTSVSRSGPSCAFAPCPAPNVDVPEAQIAFVLPAGYTQAMRGAATQETLRIFDKPSSSEDFPHLITIKRYPIPEGKTAEAVILEQTRFQPADMPAESMEDFNIVVLGGKTFYATVIERFEAQVESAYYLPRETDVLRFSVLERDVTNWTEPTLVLENLPEHRSLLTLLESLQSI